MFKLIFVVVVFVWGVGMFQQPPSGADMLNLAAKAKVDFVLGYNKLVQEFKK